MGNPRISLFGRVDLFTIMLKNLTNDPVESDRLIGLIRFFSRNCSEWKAALPAQSDRVVYAARETDLRSTYPLFAAAYELWYILNYISMDREAEHGRSLAQLRMLLEVIWDLGSTDYINWDVGNADRWDDYWNLVQRLARESLGGAKSEQPFELHRHLSVVSTET